MSSVSWNNRALGCLARGKALSESKQLMFRIGS